MGITIDLLHKLNACSEGTQYFWQQYGENDVPIEKLIVDPDMPDEFKYWGIEHFALTEEQEKLYNTQMGIKSSDYVYQSKNVQSSGNVVKSSDVTDSAFIFYSHNITNGRIIVGSSYVDGAESIYRSDFINNCTKIVHSQNITRSHNVCYSNFVIDSLDIFKCKNVTYCGQLRECTDMESSYFCADCHRVKHAMFSYKLHDTDPDKYYVFNVEVSKQQFEAIYDNYTKMMDQLVYVDEWPEDIVVTPMVRPHSNFATHYLLEKDTIRWIKSLPNYSGSLVMYPITMNPNFLE